MHWLTGVSMGAALAALGGGAARADVTTTRPSPGGGVPCPDWCGTEPGWRSPGPGTGPEIGPMVALELGAATAQVRALTAGARSETAAVAGFEFRFPRLAGKLDDPQRALRLRVDMQRLSWRLGTAASPAGLRRADGTAVPTADAGASVGLGLTEPLAWLSRQSSLAATADLEGATGLSVQPGLGLRTLDVSTRATGAAGLALGLHSRVGGLRGHARLVRALTDGAGWTNALDVGAGVATRFDWPRFRGPWPVEVWLDVRDRRGLGDDRGAQERTLTTGINYIASRGFSRIGLAAIASQDRAGDGTTATGRALVVQLVHPFGDL